MAKVVKKQWVQITAPSNFKVRAIGESFVANPEDLVGRKVNVNLMNLTNDPKTQNIRMDFKVIDAKKDKTVTRAVSYKIAPASIKRFVRRGSSRIDDSFICRTKDDILVRLKPFFLTRSRVTGKVAKVIRKSARSHLVKHANNTPYDRLVDSIVSYHLQRDLRKVLSKFHPLKTCEIRSMEMTVSKKAKEPEKKVVKKAKVEEKKEAKEEKAEVEKKAPEKEVKETEEKTETKEKKPVEKEAKVEKK